MLFQDICPSVRPSHASIVSKIEFFEIQDDGGRHLENRFFGQYSSTDCLISAKFCTTKQNVILSMATGQKMQMCKIQDGGQPPF